jgi:hypothetical protein
MKFFDRNIDARGRLWRALLGAVLIGAGLLVHQTGGWLCTLLVIAGGFCLFEAARGWCLARACGIKTRL